VGRMVDVELDIVAAERRREVWIDIVRGGRRARQGSLKGSGYRITRDRAR
jgi:hypothetical protein